MIDGESGALGEVEEFVRWLGKADALREVFPEYVLHDSSDYRAACDEIRARRRGVTAIAEQLNPGIARRINTCLDKDDLEATAIACQRLFLILEPEGHLEC